ncbi:hypothetical protein [Rhodopirellula sp. MGV]|uniref:hypothetical protein n=1 Tax=Rhodopirellula sp. MGV TaxID=2023130 RepID=UPI000B961893|nr:hypothetical protein [Rhodopirellula sp. MGV]OYP34417.1 hypothetical protein CGZ80_15315 [Rhodopirellula sp. MGV]PNY37408.1 hypothetical protein C2E31_07710 [Rhodopirellula baltica]
MVRLRGTIERFNQSATLFLLLVAFDSSSILLADDTRQAEQETQPISLDQFPPPPADLEQLIRRGNVRLITGGEPKSELSNLDANSQLAGETRFHFNYRYQSNARWRVFRNRGAATSSNTTADNKSVRIDVRFHSINLEQTHEIWLRQVPPSNSFWKHPVVRHEFDHVQISSDERIENYFRDGVKSARRFTVPLAEVANEQGRVDDAKVRQQIERKLQELLHETSELVRVRYLELDRVTRHGIRPLPNDWVPLPDENP